MISVAANLLREYRFKRSIRSLIKKGMKIGTNVHIMPGVFFDEAYAFLISIGDNCGIASGVKVFAHDGSAYSYLGFARIGKVEIKDNTRIGANAIILPGVTIGPNVLIGAGSVVHKDIPENSFAFGNPARIIAKLDGFLQTQKERCQNSKTFQYESFFYEENIKILQSPDFKEGYLIGGETETNLKWLDDERCKE